MTGMRDEGVIKFNCDWIADSPPPWHKVESLNAWRQIMYEAGLIGAYADGIGYGNVSIRDTDPSSFFVTGSGTGTMRSLGPGQFTRVTEYDIESNFVRCKGPVRASSESLTHAAFYTASRSIQAVIHIHHAGLWHRYLNRLPTTSPSVAYGTPEMALEVARLLKENTPSRKQLVIMGGHEEGVMAYGSSLGQAGSLLLNCCDRLFRHSPSSGR